MDTNLLWEDNCGSPLHLVLIQEGVIHSLDRPHLLWPRRQHAHSHYLVPATSKHDNVSELEALPRLNLQGLLTRHLTTPHGTSRHTSQHLRHLRHTSPTCIPICKMQTVKQTPATHHCLQRMPTGRSEPHAQLATQRGCNTCRWCLFTPLSTLMNV